MTAYRSRETGEYPISVVDLRRSSQFGFGEEPNSELLELMKMDPVREVPPPVFDPKSQFLREGTPNLVSGYWEQNWIIEPLPPQPELPYYIPLDVFRERAKALGLMEDLMTYLINNPALLGEVFSVREGIDPKNEDLLDGFAVLRLPKEIQDQLLARPGG